MREAIKILEAYGVVYIKRAEGTFVNDTYNHKMLDPMLYGILLDKNMSCLLYTSAAEEQFNQTIQ